jgi:REP element-mobilizing transposase RayT
MTLYSDSLHHVVVYITERKPLLEGELKAMTEHGIQKLSIRFPGLKLIESTVHPDRVELLLDFQRIDEDVLRVIQSLKAEVKTLARKKGFEGDSLWQWQFDDEWISKPSSS